MLGRRKSGQNEYPNFCFPLKLHFVSQISIQKFESNHLFYFWSQSRDVSTKTNDIIRPAFRKRAIQIIRHTLQIIGHTFQIIRHIFQIIRHTLQIIRHTFQIIRHTLQKYVKIQIFKWNVIVFQMIRYSFSKNASHIYK